MTVGVGAVAAGGCGGDGWGLEKGEKRWDDRGALHVTEFSPERLEEEGGSLDPRSNQ